MRSERLQAVLVLGLNGVRLLNKEQVVHHDDKGDDIDGAAAERGKRERGLEERGCRGDDAELKRAIHLRRLVGALDPYVESRLPVAMPAIPMTRLAMPRTK